MPKKNAPTPVAAPRQSAAKPVSPKDWEVDGQIVAPCRLCGNLPQFSAGLHDRRAKTELGKIFWVLSCGCAPQVLSVGPSKKEAAYQWNERSTGGWVSPATKLPDDDMCVLIRVQSEDWPIALGWRDGDIWRDLSADTIDNAVTGWMHMEDAAAILDTIAFVTPKGPTS